MRLPSVMVAVLLFSSAVFAQHSSPSSAPSSPPPSPPASAAPSSPPPAPAPSSSSSASSFHSEPSGPSPSSTPSFSSSNSMGSHVSSAPASSNSESSASHAAAPSSGTTSERLSPEPKIPGNGKIVPSSRIGDVPAAKEKEKGERAAESDLRRPICKDGPCKEVTHKEPVESDLRHPVCKDKPCTCPPGEATGKNGGCVAAPTNSGGSCGAGEDWNGAACVASGGPCAADTYWNGASCVARQTECAGIEARASALANEVRAARAQMQDSCSNNPSEQECSDRKQNYEGTIERYRMLLNEAPANCRSVVPDPLSL